MSEFEKAIAQAAQNSVLKIISDGNWIATDYSTRFKLPPEMLAEVWAMVDIDGLKRKMADRIESELADRIVNHMAADLATDIKQLLSVTERREAIRSVAREHLSHIMQEGISK
jgi:Mg/Co/Ni transporter MgtE